MEKALFVSIALLGLHGVRTDKYKLMRYFGVWDRNKGVD